MRGFTTSERTEVSSLGDRLARCDREIALAIAESHQPHTEMEHAGILVWEMDWRMERETSWQRRRRWRKRRKRMATMTEREVADKQAKLAAAIKELEALQAQLLSCPCGAKAGNSSKERARFLRRHPVICGGKAAEVKSSVSFCLPLLRIGLTMKADSHG